MCVAVVAWRADPRWRVVLAGNRDEFHARPAAALAQWDGAPVLAGRDLRSGGTWLGVSPAGRLAVVTNLSGHAPDPAAPSRGGLVTDALTGGVGGDDGDDGLARFNAFNLIVATTAGAHLITNRPTPVRRVLRPGIHGLSNGAIDSAWPKVTRLNAAMRGWLDDGAGDPAALLDILASDRLARPDSDGPRSRLFIRDPVYGTRCSTVVAIDAAGKGTMIERRYDAAATVSGETRRSFGWPG